MGGGAGMLGLSGLPAMDDACRRKDGRDLTREWLNENPDAKLVTNTQDLFSVDIANTSRLMGIFSDDHMPYAEVKSNTVPSLANMTLQAIRMLKKNKKGFFLMVSYLSHLTFSLQVLKK